MNDQKFIERVFELAFGDNAIERDYTREEVLEKLREFSDNALVLEALEARISALESEMGEEG
jgi:hypothetical protein